MSQNLSQSAHRLISASREFYEKTYAKHQKTLTERTQGDSITLADSVSTALDRRSRASPIQSPFESTYKNSCSLFESTQKDTLGTARTVKTVLSKNSDEIFMNENNGESVEKLLEEGYMAVVSKSDTKEVLKKNNENLEREIARVKKEMEPELERTKKLDETLRECQGIQAKYVEEINTIEGEIRKIKELIYNKKQENGEKEIQMLMVINQRGCAINGLKQEAIRKEESDKEKLVELTNSLQLIKREEQTLNSELNSLKRQYGQVRGIQGRKKEVIEEKSRMFIGMLQHK